jgi:acyl-CoA thioesterase-1
MRKFLKQIVVSLVSIPLLLGAAQAEPVRITAFGDSLVQGYGLPQGEGLVAQLRDWFAVEGFDVALTNAGVSGDTTAGGAARIDWTLAETPDAMIVLLGGNDLLRGLPPEDTRANLSRIIEAARGAGAEVLLIGMQAPGNYGADYKAAFDSIYPDLTATHDLVLHPFAFAGMAAEAGEDPAQMGAYMQADGIHPKARGVALNIKAMEPALHALMARLSQPEDSANN